MVAFYLFLFYPLFGSIHVLWCLCSSHLRNLASRHIPQVVDQKNKKSDIRVQQWISGSIGSASEKNDKKHILGWAQWGTERRFSSVYCSGKENSYTNEESSHWTMATVSRCHTRVRNPDAECLVFIQGSCVQDLWWGVRCCLENLEEMLN